MTSHEHDYDKRPCQTSPPESPSRPEGTSSMSGSTQWLAMQHTYTPYLKALATPKK